jgi:hypothetical protein
MGAHMKRELLVLAGAREFTYDPPLMLEIEPNMELLSQLGIDPDDVINCRASVRRNKPVWLVKIRNKQREG